MGKKERFFCQSESKINHRKVNYYCCKKCAAIIQSPYPNPEILQKYYESYFDIKQTLNSGYLTENQYNSLKSERDKTLKELGFDKKRIESGINVELGCANGLFLRYLAENGSTKTLGIDVSHSLLQEACRRLEKAKIVDCLQTVNIDKDFFANEKILLSCESSLEKLPESSVDNLYMFHLLEHTVEPGGVIQQASKVLKKDGVFVLEVPVSGVVSSFFHDKWRFLMPDEHLNIPSVRSVKTLARQNGFLLKSITRFGSGVTSGTTARFIKNIADKTAKIFKFGDRAAFMFIKK
jgi:SAM-dependent methyltransferase